MRIFARARASSKNLSPAGAQNPTQKNEIFSPQKITGLGIAHAAEERLVSAACPLNSLNAHLLGGVRREQERGTPSRQGALIKIHFRRNAVSILRSWTKHTICLCLAPRGALFSH